MPELDGTDMEILRLLMDDARRPWAEIAEAVDLSPPAVSDRVDRLREAGVIRRFTLDVDRSQLRAGVPVLLELSVSPEAFEDVRERLRNAEAVEHVFATAEHDLVCNVRVPDGDVPAWVAGTLDGDAVDGPGVEDYEVTLLTGAEWTPTVGGADFALTCAECGNTVTSEGTTATVGGQRRHFCCPSCEGQFRDRYERIEEGA